MIHSYFFRPSREILKNSTSDNMTIGKRLRYSLIQGIITNRIRIFSSKSTRIPFISYLPNRYSTKLVDGRMSKLHKLIILVRMPSTIYLLWAT